MENYILKRVLIEDGILYNPTVLPELLRDCVLILAHDKQGHNGALRVYNSIKRLYYWKGRLFYEETNPNTLQQMYDMCKVQFQGTGV